MPGDSLSPVPTAKGMVTIAVAVLQASWAGTCLIELHSHQQRHPKVFCEICEKSFKTSQQLKRHKWMHTGEKPFQCKICQKSFNQTGVLSRHVATHRAHSCDKCEKSFQHGIELENHKQQHSDIFCKSCGKYYKVQNDLKKHQAKFYQPKIPCNLCDKSFSKTSDLLRHTARHKILHILVTSVKNLSN